FGLGAGSDPAGLVLVMRVWFSCRCPLRLTHRSGTSHPRLTERESADDQWVLREGESSDDVGASRERKVAELTKGTIPSGEPGKPGLLIKQPNVGTTDVDVIGEDGSYIAVGGPAKAKKLASLGQKLNILKWAANQAGKNAQAYFEEGTPDTAINLAKKILGPENVKTFKR
ncbi:hypothetical protein QMK19_33530, partial [Streptomyces sp. H10-C2]|nr:hypothetical protein [Streptomyces sp. PH10-H1]MDJ0374415.1 hypothetical protein [Streptomyces sp. H10-C2]